MRDSSSIDGFRSSMWRNKIAKCLRFKREITRVAYFHAIHLALCDEMLISVDLMLQTQPNACARSSMVAPVLLSF